MGISVLYRLLDHVAVKMAQRLAVWGTKVVSKTATGTLGRVV